MKNVVDIRLMPEHIHRFIIPAAYAFTNYHPVYDGNGHVSIVPSSMALTELMCECGKTKRPGDHLDD